MAGHDAPRAPSRSSRGGLGRLLLPLVTLAAITPGASARAQAPSVGDPDEAYLRVLQISGLADVGSFMVRPMPADEGGARWAAEGHPWSGRLGAPPAGGTQSPRFTRDDARLRVFLNSRFPTGQNDGVVWQGRGVTTALDAGGTLSWRGLTVAIRPTLLFTQNSSFELAPGTGQGASPYAYPWRAIDLPQRFGPDAFWTLDPGQSELRLNVRGVAAGISTANLWWGPAIQNGVVMTNNAAGFPHVFLGTGTPARTPIGDFEARWIWGDLDPSEWIDATVTRPDRFVTGLVATYSPSFLAGLSVGATRVFYGSVPDGGVPLGDYFAVFQGLRKRTFATPQNPTGDDEHDQLLSLFGRWVLAESGFEVYGEWARNDHSWDLRDFLLEPEHSQGYTLGLQKAVALTGDRLLSLRGEVTRLERGTTLQVRAVPTYYAHHIVTEGYTQKGQVIGAGVGPGGNAQHVGADLYAPWGRAGVYLQRDVHDNDAYYAWAEANGADFCCHNVSFHLGARGVVFVGDLDLGAGMVVTREFNRYFFGLDLWNLNLSVSARWRPQ